MHKRFVQGGTESPGVAKEVFVMPAGMTIRYDSSAQDISECISGYHVYATQGVDHLAQVDWFLPGTANVRVALDAGEISVSIGHRTFAPLPQASFFGPSSIAAKAVTNGGVVIGFGITALGWGRLSHRSASDFHNRIMALPEVLGQTFTNTLVTQLARSDREHEVKPLLDELLRTTLGPAGPDEALIRQLSMMITAEHSDRIEVVAEQLGVTPHTLRRVAVRYFGLPPKLLLTRARFLRSFLKLALAGDPTHYSMIDASYFDPSHFLRDANRFLGTTPRRFLARELPFLRASMKARAAVLGTATQALHQLPNPPEAGSG